MRHKALLVSEGHGILYGAVSRLVTSRRWFSALSFVDVSSAAIIGDR